MIVFLGLGYFLGIFYNIMKIGMGAKFLGVAFLLGLTSFDGVVGETAAFCLCSKLGSQTVRSDKVDSCEGFSSSDCEGICDSDESTGSFKCLSLSGAATLSSFWVGTFRVSEPADDGCCSFAENEDLVAESRGSDVFRISGPFSGCSSDSGSMDVKLEIDRAGRGTSSFDSNPRYAVDSQRDGLKAVVTATNLADNSCSFKLKCSDGNCDFGSEQTLGTVAIVLISIAAACVICIGVSLLFHYCCHKK